MDSNYRDTRITDDDMGEGYTELISEDESEDDRRQRHIWALLERLRKEEWKQRQKIHSRK